MTLHGDSSLTIVHRHFLLHDRGVTRFLLVSLSTPAAVSQHLYTKLDYSSLALAATVHGWWAKSVTALRKLSIIGRVLPVTLAVISIVLLQLEFAHNSFITYMVIANAQCTFSTSDILVPRFSLVRVPNRLWAPSTDAECSCAKPCWSIRISRDDPLQVFANTAATQHMVDT